MKNKGMLSLLLFCSMLLLNSCKKDYITGGTVEDSNMYKNVTTYNFLASNALYDTLVQVIDAAGLQDKINQQDVTFFAPSDYSIYTYLSLRTLYVQNNINIESKFGLDSLLYYVSNNINGTRDSLLMYLILKPLPYSVLTDAGSYYATELTGDSAIVSYEYTKEEHLGYNSNVSGVPQLVYYTHVWYPYELNSENKAGDIPEDIGVHTLVKVSGIQTQTGLVNELENAHTLFFYNTKQ